MLQRATVFPLQSQYVGLRFPAARLLPCTKYRCWIGGLTVRLAGRLVGKKWATGQRFSIKLSAKYTSNTLCGVHKCNYSLPYFEKNVQPLPGRPLTCQRIRMQCNAR